MPRSDVPQHSPGRSVCRSTRVLGILAIQLAAAAMVWRGELPAQVRVTVPDTPTCSTCVILIDRMVNLAPPADGMPGVPSDVTVDQKGRIYLAFSPPPEFIRFTPEGMPDRQWRQEGEGPGEYRMIRYVVATNGDSLFVFDPMLRRVSVLDPAGGFVRSFRAPAGMGAPVETADGRLVINDVIGQPDRVGFPFHEFTRQGLLGRSFGSEHANLRPTEHWRLRYLTSPAAGGRSDEFWGIREIGSYEIELWGVGETRPRRILARQAAWYPPYPATGVLRPSLDTPPQPRVLGFWQDSSSLLWVVLRVPDRRWKSAIASGRVSGESSGARGEGNGLTIVSPQRYTDIRIEVIDPVRGQLIAVHQFDTSLWGGSGHGMLLGKVADFDDDNPSWSVVWPKLVGYRQPSR